MSKDFSRRRTVRFVEAERRIATGWRIGLSPSGTWRVFHTKNYSGGFNTLDRQFALRLYLELVHAHTL